MVIGSCLVAIPGGLALFPILDTGSAAAFFVGLTMTLAIMGISYGPAGALLPEMFKTEYRYTGAGMAYAIVARRALWLRRSIDPVARFWIPGSGGLGCARLRATAQGVSSFLA